MCRRVAETAWGVLATLDDDVADDDELRTTTLSQTDRQTDIGERRLTAIVTMRVHGPVLRATTERIAVSLT